MNKINFISILILIYIQTFGQNIISPPDIEIQNPLFKNNKVIFGSLGSSFSFNKDLAFNSELGILRLHNKMSYSFTFDLTKNLNVNNSTDLLLGIKIYYSFLNKKLLNCNIYFSPKIDITNLSFENGLDLNFLIKNNVIADFDVCLQYNKSFLFSPNMSFSFIFLITEIGDNPIHKHKSIVHHNNHKL